MGSKLNPQLPKGDVNRQCIKLIKKQQYKHAIQKYKGTYLKELAEYKALKELEMVSKWEEKTTVFH